MTKHQHDDGDLVRRTVDYEYVQHHEDAKPGLLVVHGVPADVCLACDEYWFDEETGFALTRVLAERAPGPGEVVTIDWGEAAAA